MVFIKKRRTPEVQIEETVAPDWRMVFRHPLLSSIVNHGTTMGAQDISAGHLLQVASLCKRGTLLQTSMQEKVFMYLLCFILWRMFGKSLLSDTEYAQLARHLFGGVIKDKIDTVGTVPLAHRMAFIFDIPEMGRLYRKPLSIPVPREVSGTVSTKKPALRRLKKKRPGIK